MSHISFDKQSQQRKPPRKNPHRAAYFPPAAQESGMLSMTELDRIKGALRTEFFYQWSFLVPLIGGRYHIIPHHNPPIGSIYHLYATYILPIA